MRDNKLHTPVGVRDVLHDECAIKQEISSRIRETFISYGYSQVETPTFEYIEVFSDEKLGSTKPEQMFKFVDRDGTTLALRSDMTPPIARVAATSFMDQDAPLRFSYFGNAFKYNENYQGKLREFSQGGVELLGINTVEADAEILSLAVNSVLSTGLFDFKINIGDVEFFKGILDETGLSEEICKILQNKIAIRDYVGAEEIVTKYDMEENIRTLFIELPKLVGTLEILTYAKSLTKNLSAKKAISRLQELYEILKCYGIENYVSFDLGMVNQLNYYTGIIFRGYTYGTGTTIVNGGRYDNLVAQYGANMPAVGFGIKISELVLAVMRENIVLKIKGLTAMIAYTTRGRGVACKIASEYRLSGMYVENSLIGDDIDKNIEYAKSKKMSHVLYFVDTNTVKVISLLDDLGGFTVEVPISDLIIPKKEVGK